MNSILGACIGDAAGATLEFYGKDISENIALSAMKMPGGGKLGVGPGQITDDGELTLSLWSAIHTRNPSHGFPFDSVIKSYAVWYESCPFDMGRTCGLAFELANDLCSNKSNNDITIKDINIIKRNVWNANKLSEANGALMRATAIATWIAKHTDIAAEVGAEFAMDDAELSHPNQSCKETNAIYVYTLINLLRGISPLDALLYTSEFIQLNEISDTVRKWYFEDSLDITNINCTEKQGWVRWGFVMAFYFLRHSYITYEEAIKQTLMKGGDTDTNAAIVGGLVASYQSIPEYMKIPVIEFDCTRKPIIHRGWNVRPIDYSLRHIVKNLIK